MLVVSIIVLIMGASSVYFLQQVPIERIEKERIYLDRLESSILNTEIELNRMYSAETYAIFLLGRFGEATTVEESTAELTAALAEELTRVGKDLESKISHFRTVSEAENDI